uniref:Uncharacterized protein n=1 Tax=Cyanothece sp. (strain PCC 7425 / ATCC 29141) TaxID=395961 RepID=B8HYR3_CYAP4
MIYIVPINLIQELESIANSTFSDTRFLIKPTDSDCNYLRAGYPLQFIYDDKLTVHFEAYRGARHPGFALNEHFRNKKGDFIATFAFLDRKAFIYLTLFAHWRNEVLTLQASSDDSWLKWCDRAGQAISVPYSQAKGVKPIARRLLKWYEEKFIPNQKNFAVLPSFYI